jgi:hypothetical protein
VHALRRYQRWPVRRHLVACQEGSMRPLLRHLHVSIVYDTISSQVQGLAWCAGLACVGLGLKPWTVPLGGLQVCQLDLWLKAGCRACSSMYIQALGCVQHAQLATAAVSAHPSFTQPPSTYLAFWPCRTSGLQRLHTPGNTSHPGPLSTCLSCSAR